ncbi:MAG: cation transporter [Clostridia bacterium]|nr:cation transporter [Clostridia bacterium]
MTKLLLRLFVRGHEDASRPAVHAAIGSLAGVTGIVCNGLLFLLKLLTGLMAGSVSIVADAFNNLSDAASSMITFLGFRMAQRPADKDHPYGHARSEYLAGLAIAAMILIIGMEQGRSAINKILQPGAISFSVLIFVLMVCAIVLKGWMALFFRTLSRKISSVALMATAIDCRNDVVATSAVLLGCLTEHVTGWNIDGYIGAAVTALILWSGVSVARETVTPLLGKQPDPAMVARLKEIVLSHEAVLGIHDLLVHDYGPGHVHATVHVEMSAEQEPLVCHDIVDDIEHDVLRELNVNLVIHHDPVETNDTERSDMYALVTAIAAEVDPRCSVHDFRIVRGQERPKLVFDMTIPYDMGSRHRQLQEAVESRLAQAGKDYRLLIRFDHE